MVHFLRLIILTLIFSSAAYAQDENIKSDVLSLTVGLTHDEKLPFVPENPKFEGNYGDCVKLSLSPETKTLRLSPEKVNTCTLTIRDDRLRKAYVYRLVVKKSNLFAVAREIKSLLGEIEGIQIKIANNKVIVDGQILLPRDMKRIASVVAQYKDTASNLVTLSPLAQRKIASFIERDVNNPDIQVRAVNNRFILEGVANDQAEKERAEIIAKTYVPDEVVESGDEAIRKRKVLQTVINLITVKQAPPSEPGKIIQVVVHYVELKKDYTRGFRFEWMPTLGDNTNVTFSSGSKEEGGFVSQITGTISNLLPKLNWAKAHGYARVLQSSSIIVQDGKLGILDSNTRVPYQTVGAEGQINTQFENVGITTKVTPQILSGKSDSIHLQVDFVVSALLGMTQNGPLINRSNVNTVIMVRSGQSAAIGGLVQSSSGTDFNKLPNSAANNPLFSLYASKNFRRDQSQFVVFITPVIKSSASEGSDEIKRKFRLTN
jgi:pilus assembly protein CpaC